MTIIEQKRICGIPVSNRVMDQGETKLVTLRDSFAELAVGPKVPVYATVEVSSPDQLIVHSLVNGLRREPYNGREINLLKATEQKPRFSLPFVKKAILWQRE